MYVGLYTAVCIVGGCLSLQCWKILSHDFLLFTQSCVTLCNPMDCSTPDFPVHSVLISWSLLRLMSIDDASVHVDIDGDMFMSVMPSNHLILCHPFLCLQSFPASGKEFGFFPMSWLFTPGGHSFSYSISIIGASASASFFTMNIEG